MGLPEPAQRWDYSGYGACCRSWLFTMDAGDPESGPHLTQEAFR